MIITKMNIILKLIAVFVVFEVNEAALVTNGGAKLSDDLGKAGDWFGASVAMNDNFIVVGSPMDDANRGSLSVYSINGNDVQLVRKILPLVINAECNFGWSVAINKNNYIVAGCPHFTEGSVYVFHRTGETWSKVKIKPTVSVDGNNFGSSVDINDNNEIIVGAVGVADKGSKSGAAYVFGLDDSSVWTQLHKLVPADLVAFDYFGGRVSITKTHAAVSAYYRNNNGDDVEAAGTDDEAPGAVYVYKKDDVGDWNQEKKLTSPTPENDGRFGESISMNGNRLVIGAFQERSKKGNVYVYFHDVTATADTAWSLETTLTSSEDNEAFGKSVSITLDTTVTIVVGADGAVGNNEIKSGSAYVFRLTHEGEWEKVTKLIPHDGAEADSFGTSVSNFKGMVVVGSKLGNRPNGEESGAVYVYNNLPVRTPIGILVKKCDCTTN